MHFLDWSIVFVFIVSLSGTALYVNKYVKDVSSFLSAKRCAGRYLLAVATGASSMCAVTIVAQWETVFKAGLVVKWWEMMIFPISLIVAITGWVVYRFRETRAMTVAQFFEARYSRKFRIYAGVLAFASGVLNFGIFPQIGARFFLYFCRLPDSFGLFGYEFSTYIVVMLSLISVALFFAFVGGQITIMITDFIQGSLINILGIVVIIYFLVVIGWPTVIEGLQIAPPEQSKLNPFQTANESDFNFTFFLIKAFYFFYCVRAFQGSQGYFSAAKSAHEQKMAGVVGQWRNYILLLLMVVVPACIYAVMHHPNFSDTATEITSQLDRVSTDVNNHYRNAMLVPIGLSNVLPVGLTGLMCIIMLGAFISVHDTYLHSWGVIFIQDVVMPFRKKPFAPKTHMKLLRASICGVAVFIFVFSIFFKLEEYIFMFMAITGSIYLGGAGSCIIGGLYWKKGSTAAAFTALTYGAVVSVASIVIRQMNPDLLPFNSQIIYGFCMLSSASLYFIVSLIGKHECNMDKLLNRGEYSIEEKMHFKERGHSKNFFSRAWNKLISDEFTSKDKKLYLATIVWVMSWVLIFLTGCAIGSFIDIPEKLWIRFWTFWFWTNLAAMIVGVSWLFVGGLVDLKSLIAALKLSKVDNSDDGWVKEEKRGEIEIPEVEKVK